MNNQVKGNERHSHHWINQYAYILCDLDGCLISGNRTMKGAQAFCNLVGERLIIISNNSVDTPETLTARLTGLGFEFKPDQIVLAGTSTIDLLAEQHPGAVIDVYGSDELRQHALTAGFSLSVSNPDFVVLARDTRFSYESLHTILAQLLSGAELWVSNIDKTHPGVNGFPVPETGALLQAISACLPEIIYQCIGKPNAHLYHTAIERFGIKLGEALAIGDNLSTDILGAKRLGLDYIMLDPNRSRMGPESLAELIQDDAFINTSSYPCVSIQYPSVKAGQTGNADTT